MPCLGGISAKLTIGGFMGSSSGVSILKKLDMLKQEGIFFIGGQLQGSDKLFKFDII